MLQRQRLVIADLFRKDEEERMRLLLGSYFEIEDVIDVSINVQKSIIKQRDRTEKFLSGNTHMNIFTEAIRQIQQNFSMKTKKSGKDSIGLIHHGIDKYEKLQERDGVGHQYLIYVLKHKEMLQNSQIIST